MHDAADSNVNSISVDSECPIQSMISDIQYAIRRCLGIASDAQKMISGVLHITRSVQAMISEALHITRSVQTFDLRFNTQFLPTRLPVNPTCNRGEFHG